MSEVLAECVRLFILASAAAALVVFAAIGVRDWWIARKARIAAKEAARRKAQERAWHEFWALMHGAMGGTPVPYDPAAYEDQGPDR